MTNPRRVLAAIVLLCVSARLAMLLYYLHRHGWVPETWEYETIATNLLAGRGFVFPHHGVEFRAYVVPVFPLYCAALHWLGGPSLWLYFGAQLAAAGLVSGLCYVLAKRMVPEQVAALVGLAAALEPGLVVYQSYKVDPLTLCQLLGLGAVWLIVREPGAPSIASCAAAGALLGLAMMTRPDLVALGVLLLSVMARSAGDRRRVRVGTVALVAAALAVMSPWFVRNYRVFDRFKPFSTMSAELLWFGNNPESIGSSLASDKRAMYAHAPPELRARVENAASELEMEQAFREAAVGYFRRSPGASLVRSARKFLYFWWFTPTFGTLYSGWLPSGATIFYMSLHATLLALFLLGLWRLRRETDRDRLAIAAAGVGVPLALACIHAVYYVEGRHRVLAMPFILLIAAPGLARLLELLRGEPVRNPA